MNRPPCYYCDGTGIDDEAERLDVDDYRPGPCCYCEGTSQAMHSANTDTTYRHRDGLLALRDNRRFGLRNVAAYKAGKARDDGFDIYLNVKRRAGIGPRAGFYAMCMVERAIRCDLACRSARQAWQRVAA